MLNDIFNGDAFSLTTLTAAINNVPFIPSRIAELAIFEEQSIATLSAVIEENQGKLELVDVAPRNGPGKPISDTKRTARSFLIPHLPERATIMADSVQGVRTFGSDSNTSSVEVKRNERLQAMRTNIDYTIESHRLSAIKGQYIDSNGVATNLYTSFGVGPQVVVPFTLSNAATDVRGQCLAVIDAIEDALGGMGFTGITALCGKNFWAQLIAHKSVVDTWKNWTAAAGLRTDPRAPLPFGGINFERYRGTSAVKVGDDEAYFFAAGVAGLFITRFAPANYIETVNTLGVPYYAKAELMPFGKGVSLEAQSNPLNLCTRPLSVVKGTA